MKQIIESGGDISSEAVLPLKERQNVHGRVVAAISGLPLAGVDFNGSFPKACRATEAARM